MTDTKADSEPPLSPQAGEDKPLTQKQKDMVEESVKLTVEKYGDTLQRLGDIDSQDELDGEYSEIYIEIRKQLAFYRAEGKPDVKDTYALPILELVKADRQRAVNESRKIIKMADSYTFEDGTTLYSERRLREAVNESRIEGLSMASYTVEKGSDAELRILRLIEAELQAHKDNSDKGGEDGTSN